MGDRHGSNQVRIIGGRWRGRRIQFPDHPSLRPSGDRIRETLFNWLMHDIHGATCLDLFAGSGVLGFESLSRGAERAVLIDNHAAAISCLKANKENLNADNAKILQLNMPQDLKRLGQSFDIVFIDPPFREHMVSDSCQALLDHNCLKPGATLYIETELSAKELVLPEPLTIQKHKSAGQVHYYLVTL